MAANLGSLVATISANTAPFQKGMKRATGFLTHFATHIGLTAAGLKSLAIAATATGLSFLVFKKVGGWMKSMLDSISEAIDELAKRSRAIGETANQLGAMQFAAELAGGSEERFFAGMMRMQLNAGKASTETRLALKALGIELKDFANLTVTGQMLALQEALQGVANKTEQAGAAALVAGGRTENMKSVMNMLGTDVRGAMEEFNRLHGVIDTAPFEKYLDAQVRLSKAWQGLKMKIVEPFIKALTTLIDVLTEIVVKLREYWPVIRNLTIALFANVGAWIAITVAIKTFGLILPAILLIVKAFVLGLRAMGMAASIATGNFVRLAASVVAFASVLVALGFAVDEMAKAEEALRKANEEIGQGDTYEGILDEARRLIALAELAQQMLNDLRTPEEVFGDTLGQLAEIKARFEELGLTAAEASLIWNRGVGKALQTLLQSKKVMDSIRQAGSLKLGTMAEASGRMAAERQQQRQTEYLNQLNQAMAVANDILADIRDKIEPPPGNVPALP